MNSICTGTLITQAYLQRFVLSQLSGWLDVVHDSPRTRPIQIFEGVFDGPVILAEVHPVSKTGNDLELFLLEDFSTADIPNLQL